MNPSATQPDPVSVAFNEGDEKYRVEVLGQMQGLVGRGVIDGHEYARGKHFFYRRSLDSTRWQLFCGADCDLTLEVAKAIHAEGRLLSDVWPTIDERAGMDWWNILSEPERAVWLERSGGKSVADAWGYFKTHHVSRGAGFLVRAGGGDTPDGYRRPMSCAIDEAPASRSIEFATALAVEMNDTDDDAEIAKLAHEIDNRPNAFVLRVHRLEKRLAALEARMRQECECGEDATTRVLVTAPRSGCVEFDADVCDDCATGARRRYDEQGYDVTVTPIGAGVATNA